MELIEMKSLYEVSLLSDLSEYRDNFLSKWSIYNGLMVYYAMKSFLDELNEFHIKYPYGLA